MLKHWNKYVKIIQISGLIYKITLYHCALFVLISTQVASSSRNHLCVSAIVDLSTIKTKYNPNRTIMQTNSYFSCDAFLRPIVVCQSNLLLRVKGAQAQRGIITCRRESYGRVPWWFGRSSSCIGQQYEDSC